MLRILVLIAMLPFLLGNSACDTIYRSLGLMDDDARYGDTSGSETPDNGGSDPAEATPYLKKDDDTGSGSDDGTNDACGASSYTGYVGGDWSALEALYSPTDNWRVIRPGQAVTTDYIPDRMNVALDGSDVITRIYCS